MNIAALARAFAHDAGPPAWKESDHPRGQPENAGEFASAPGGARKQKGAHPPAKHPPDTTAAEAVARSDLHRDAIKYAASVGFDPEKVIATDATYQFEVDGRKMLAAGTYSPSRGAVYVYQGQATPDFLPGLMAHEIMHHKWQVVNAAYDAEREQVSEAVKASDYAKLDEIMYPSGILREPYDKKWPIYQAMESAMHGYERERDVGMSSFDAFRESDGVSDYSLAYWKDAKVGKATVDLAINETLAEMARLKQEKGGGKPEHYGWRLLLYRGKVHDPQTGKETDEWRPLPTKTQQKLADKLWENLYSAVQKCYPEAAARVRE
jgi:hypothetical protein